MIASAIFLDIFYVILLSVAATVLVSGVLIVRRFLQIANVRSQSEIIKAQTVRDSLAHEMATASIRQEKALLQLTALVPEQPKEAAKPDLAEKVEFKKKDVQHPVEGLMNKFLHRNEDAEDAEFSEGGAAQDFA